MTGIRPAHPEVSVVVSTYRRAALLPRLIRALEAQTLERDRYEVIVVDNASPDDTAQVLEHLREATDLDLVVDRTEVNRGPASGRNLGLARARGTYVAFTDDDCVPRPTWLERLLATADGTSQVVVGRTIAEAGAEAGPFDRVLRVDDARYMQTCNVAYRRFDLDRLGGFDERIAFGEDTDLGLRAIESGVRPVFAEDAVVVHDVRARSWWEAVIDTTAWVDLPLVVRRHPSIRDTHLHRRVFWKRSHPATLLGLVGLFVATRRPVAGGLLVLPWLRYRLVAEPLAPGRWERTAALPGAFAIDVAEIVAMARGALRHRTLML